MERKENLFGNLISSNKLLKIARIHNEKFGSTCIKTHLEISSRDCDLDRFLPLDCDLSALKA